MVARASGRRASGALGQFGWGLADGGLSVAGIGCHDEGDTWAYDS